MSCYHPLIAVRGARNSIRVVGAKSSSAVVDIKPGSDVLELPCGQCIGCRLNRSCMWAVRCMHEAQMWPLNCFVTLTYDPQLPVNKYMNWSLEYSHFQKFMKRLRRVRPGVRFFACGEYGDTYGRPHFHAILFNCFFPDRLPHGKSESGADVWISRELDDIWSHGNCHIGEMSFQSAAYVARYAVKSAIDGYDGKRRAVGKGGFLDAETGEYWPYVPEMIRMSLKPGIGSKWFEKYASDVLPRDYVIVDGQKSPVPRYYLKMFNKLDTFGAELVKFKRLLRGEREDLQLDKTHERLLVRETVARAGITFKRSA